MSAAKWMIYGATGYTGELIAREAVRQGLRPILAGRNPLAVESLAHELGLEPRIVSLHEARALHAALHDVSIVLHCAGPFIQTSKPMVRACLAQRVHYLDITGEIGVFESLLAQGFAARERGIVVLPGVGFDVVPSDCLAGCLADALPDASDLDLAFVSDHPGLSRGTLKTMIESLPHVGAVRREGRIEPVPLAYDVRQIQFSCGVRWTMTIPWGDVATAYHTTGIPNIRVYTGTSRAAVDRLRWFAPLIPLASRRPVKRFLQRIVESQVSGPDEATRRSARVHLWGEACNQAGEMVSMTLDTPEAYALTAVSALAAVQRVASGSVPAGSWTPARAFGPQFALGLPGVVASDIVRHLPPTPSERPARDAGV
jgi:short subunit dehydrogenase-like uncharacterized protein